ncbi:S24 family peptidase [Streptomyces viridochromogenes]|uniref:LexA family protein n=1 Tax=Streptomyces viridochromogenes TaxID=1938 RepID=UPI00190F8351
MQTAPDAGSYTVIQWEYLPQELEFGATVKVLRRQDGQVCLMPRNPAYQPLPGDRAQIIGKVVGVLRLL